MIRKLHIQLTALSTAVTGLILGILTLICLFISESGIKEQESASFLTNLNTMYQNLQTQTTISHEWIRQMEFNNQFSIRLLDNGTPLFFQNLSEDKNTAALMEMAMDAARDEYSIDLRQPSGSDKLSRQEEFRIKDDEGLLYDASAALFPRSTGVLGIMVLHPLTSMDQRILRQRLSFLLADLAALLLLGIFFWYFTAKMIRPLQENRRKQNQFIAAASHELRAPLTVILSNVTAVRNGIMPEDGQFLDTIDSECLRMSRLIEDMLQLASADNHTWSIRSVPTELDTLLLETWESYEAQAYAKGLLWNVVLPEDSVPRINCDPERIRQLLSILIDNAFSYTPQGGRIGLSLELGPSQGGRISTLRICLSDNGPGIPDQYKEAVFERFCRLDSSRKDKSHFGLGLSIAQEIVRLHRGQLLLGDTPGGGATFTVVLPMLKA